jgi:hypothetical protein
MLEKISKTTVVIKGPLSHSQVRRRFQRRAANAADHGRTVAAGKRIGDFPGAVRAIKRVV